MTYSIYNIDAVCCSFRRGLTRTKYACMRRCISVADTKTTTSTSLTFPPHIYLNAYSIHLFFSLRVITVIGCCQLSAHRIGAKMMKTQI